MRTCCSDALPCKRLHGAPKGLSALRASCAPCVDLLRGMQSSGGRSKNENKLLTTKARYAGAGTHSQTYSV